MRGGWRWNSGRKGWKEKVEDHRSIDIRLLARKRMLVLDNLFSLNWCNQKNEKTGSISVWVETDDLLTLKYRWQKGGDKNWRYSSFSIHLTRTPSQFGGKRTWFTCPHCDRRAAILYMSQGRWFCRRSLTLAYYSQSEDFWGRMGRKKWKAGIKLGGNGRRPKGMHSTTYKRLRTRWVDLEMAYDEMLESEVHRRFEAAGINKLS